MNRSDVYQLIDGERQYQDNLWGRSGQPNTLTVGEFVLLLSEYVDKAKAQWTIETKPEFETKAIVRKIAAIAVNCMEQHGARPR